MGLLTFRRRALRKRLAARERGESGLEKTWQGKQEAEEGTPLPEGFPFLSILQANGYSTYEDLSGTTEDELVALSGIAKKGAQKILSAAAEGPVVSTPSNPDEASPLASGDDPQADDNMPPEGSEPTNPDGTVPDNEKTSLSGSGETTEGMAGSSSEGGVGG